MGDLVRRRDALDAMCDNCDTVQAVCAHFPCTRYIAVEKLPAGKERPCWIKCEEVLPEEKRAVLVYAPLRKNIYMGYYDSVFGWMTWDPTFSEPFPVSVGVIAAWMPLPKMWGDE